MSGFIPSLSGLHWLAGGWVELAFPLSREVGVSSHLIIPSVRFSVNVFFGLCGSFAYRGQLLFLLPFLISLSFL